MIVCISFSTFLACLTFHWKVIRLCHFHKRTNPGSAPAILVRSFKQRGILLKTFIKSKLRCCLLLWIYKVILLKSLIIITIIIIIIIVIIFIVVVSLRELLFNMCLNDLSVLSEFTDVCNFADDTLFYVCDIDLNSLLEQDSFLAKDCGHFNKTVFEEIGVVLKPNNSARSHSLEFLLKFLYGFTF